MNILSIDTTTKKASVSIKNNDNFFSEYIDNEITHSEKLLPLIDETLKKANLKLSDIDSYACITGPGSFTGIRIGLSTLKAFAQVNNKKIFGISTLDSLNLKTYIKSANYTQKKELYIASLIDAKNNRVYYNFSKLSVNNDNKIEIQKIIEISNLYISEALEKIAKICKDLNITNITFSTDIKEKVSDNIKDIFNINKISFNLIFSYPTSSDLFEQIENISNKEDYIFNAFTLNAIYARLSQAERVKNNEK